MSVTKTRRHLITECEATNRQFVQLYFIFTATLCPGMPFRVFRTFYYTERLDYIDVSFMYSGSDIIGFCSAAFYKTTLDGRPIVIGRAATGILSGQRGGKFPFRALFSKYMLYKAKHPFTNILLTIFVANPLIYALICKYTGIVYPRLTVDVNGRIQELKNAVLHDCGLAGKERHPFVVKIHFKVEMGKDILQRVTDSNNIFVRYYLTINPGYNNQYGVLTLVPVTWENIFHSLARLINRSTGKRAGGSQVTEPEKTNTDETKVRLKKYLNFHVKKRLKSYAGYMLRAIEKQITY